MRFRYTVPRTPWMSGDGVTRFAGVRGWAAQTIAAPSAVFATLPQRRHLRLRRNLPPCLAHAAAPLTINRQEPWVRAVLRSQRPGLIPGGVFTFSGRRR